MSVKILVSKQTGEEETLEFDSPTELKVGRSQESGLRLEGDGLVSRNHAVVIIDPPTVKIVDLKSTNGITINDVVHGGPNRSASSEPIDLRNGDVVKIGKTRLRIALPGNGGNTSRFGSGAFIPEIPGYRIEKVIGQGGMGAVYKGVAEDSGDQVAIKVMMPNIMLNKKMIDTFTREIEVTKSIVHPNIVKFYAAGVAQKTLLYLILEYINGGDLAKYIDNYPGRIMPLRQAYNLMLQIADGLGYANTLGFVHRDIKPHNILLMGEGDEVTAKITDLGLAKNFENSGMSGLTTSFAGGGTMAYMPPEQLTDFRDVKPTADVFSAGATFYEMLVGRIPYNFKKKGDRIKTISDGDITLLAERAPELPRSLTRVVDRCLSRNPDQRYQDCKQLHDALTFVEF